MDTYVTYRVRCPTLNEQTRGLLPDAAERSDLIRRPLFATILAGVCDLDYGRVPLVLLNEPRESIVNTGPSGRGHPTGGRWPPDVMCHSQTPLPQEPKEPDATDRARRIRDQEISDPIAIALCFLASSTIICPACQEPV
jgi:hypothetical protein